MVGQEKPSEVASEERIKSNKSDDTVVISCHDIFS